MDAPRRRRTSRLRKAALQLGLSLVALIAVELALRAAGVGPDIGDDPYVGFDGVVRLYAPDPDEPGLLVTAEGRRNHFNVQRFAAEKPAGVRRVFCVGGSTTYGRPYTDVVSFPGWLRELLPLVDPDTAWEVINAGGVSYASYRVAVVVDELTAYEPDLVVIYTGHNEFLEERTYGEVRDTSGLLLGLGAALRDTALFTLARRAVGTAPREVERFELGAEVETILDGSVGLEAFERDDELAAGVAAHYRDSLERMVLASRAAGAEVLLVVPASELADCAPFKSEPDMIESVELLNGLSLDGVETSLHVEEADRHPRAAGVQYLLGRDLLADVRAGRRPRADLAAARALLERARDEDIVPLRATSALQSIVRDVAERLDVPLLDAVEVTDALAERLTGIDIPGAEVFLDHVHMTPEAYREVALGVIDTLVDSGWLRQRDDWRAALPAVVARVEASLSTEDHVRALSRLAAVLDWAGKSDEAARHTARAVELSGGGDAMSLWLLGNTQLDTGDLAAAIDAYARALDVDPDYTEAHLNLAMTLLQQGDPARAADALGHAERAAELGGASARTDFARGLALERLGRAPEAEAAYAAAARSPDGHADASNRLGLLAMARGDREAAMDAFRAAADADPRAARPLYNLGQLLAAADRLDEAERAWRDALVREPGHGGASARLGLLLRERGAFGEALPHLEAAVRARPDDAGLRAARDDVRARAGA